MLPTILRAEFCCHLAQVAANLTPFTRMSSPERRRRFAWQTPTKAAGKHFSDYAARAILSSLCSGGSLSPLLGLTASAVGANGWGSCALQNVVTIHQTTRRHMQERRVSLLCLAKRT
jgi:hypothetical protein